MAADTLQIEHWVPARRAHVFSLFTHVPILSRLLPPWLRLESPHPVVGLGTRLEFRLVRPFATLGWRTVVVEWHPLNGYTEHLEHGPYEIWEHRHSLTECDGGTLCTDVIRYALPETKRLRGIQVRRDLQRAFAFRTGMLRQIFTPGG